MKKLLFLAIIFFVFIYFQYSFIHDINDSYEILQHNNPNKDLFENIHQDKLISIFTNIPFNININNTDPDNEYQYSDFKNDYIHQNTEKINKIINANLSYYEVPLCVSNKIFLKYQQFDTRSPLIYQDCYRHLIFQLEGTMRFFIFSPKYHKNLYIENKSTQLDFWNQDVSKFPLVSKAQYVEVILHPGQMISIPMKWVYAFAVENDSLTVLYNSESIFSYLLK